MVSAVAENIDAQTTALVARAKSMSDTADALEVRDAETFVLAGTFLREIKEYRRQVDDAFDSLVEEARRTWKATLAKKEKYEAPAIEAEKLVKAKIGAYQEAAERQRREEEARLREEARRKAEEEALARAVEAEAAGFGEAVDEILDAPPTPVVPVILPPVAPKVAGISMRTTWKFRVVDEAAIPREYLKIDEAKIGGVVRAMKGGTKIAGVEVFEEKVVSAR